MENGLFQGLRGAVFEFLIYMDEAMKKFRHALTSVELKDVEFADDLILATETNSVKYTLKKLKEKFDEFNLEINFQKSEFI